MDDHVISAKDLLVAFSEYLDGEGLAVTPANDDRTHDDLARLFLASMEGTPLGQWAAQPS